MPPSNKLEIVATNYREKPILYRRNHVNIKFRNFLPDSPEARHFLDAHLGPNMYGILGRPVGTWACLWTEVSDQDFLSRVGLPDLPKCKIAAGTGG